MNQIPVQCRHGLLVWLLAGLSCLSGVPCVSAAETATAAAPPQDASALRLWINPGVHSFHFDRSQGLRENNYGLGLEAATRDDLSLMAGEYRNSNDRATRYLALSWRPLEWGAMRFGVMAAAFNGYPKVRDGAWFGALLPVASLEYGRVGVNFTVVPTYKDQLYGAFAVQVKLRIW